MTLGGILHFRLEPRFDTGCDPLFRQPTQPSPGWREQVDTAPPPLMIQDGEPA